MKIDSKFNLSKQAILHCIDELISVVTACTMLLLEYLIKFKKFMHFNVIAMPSATGGDLSGIY